MTEIDYPACLRELKYPMPAQKPVCRKPLKSRVPVVNRQLLARGRTAGEPTTRY